MKLNNASTHEFTDISSEQYRQYEFKDGRNLRIVEPVALSVSKSGGHRILDSQGVSHYIPPTWYHLSWKAKDGSPHFVA